MKPYVLSCCSTADLSREHFESRKLEYVCFHYALDGQEYVDEGVRITLRIEKENVNFACREGAKLLDGE